MCDFGISETIAATTAAIAASTSAAASSVAAGATAIGSGIASAASAAGGAISSGIGSAIAAITGETVGGIAGATTGTMSAELASLLGVTTSVSEAGALATTGSTAGQIAGTAIGTGQAAMGFAEYAGIASSVLGVAGGGASAGVNAKQAKEQGTLIKAQAREEARNIRAQANVEAQGNAQKNFELAAAALAARGEVNAANLGDRSVRAIGRAVGFQLGTDKATVQKNQEIANSIASARLRGVAITKQSARLQVGNPGVIAGVGAVNSLASGLNAGAGAYNAFSKFKIPTDGINLAFPS